MLIAGLYVPVPEDSAVNKMAKNQELKVQQTGLESRRNDSIPAPLLSYESLAKLISFWASDFSSIKWGKYYIFHGIVCSFVHLCFLSFLPFFSPCFLGPNGGSQARGWMGAAPNPWPMEPGQGIKPTHSWILVRLIPTELQQELLYANFFFSQHTCWSAMM